MVTDRSPGLPRQEVEGRIIAFIRSELLGPEVTFDRDDELLEGDLLDSIGVLRLATFLEQEFHFKVQPADFVVENFQTVAVLAEYVRRAVGPAGRSPAVS